MGFSEIKIDAAENSSLEDVNSSKNILEVENSLLKSKITELETKIANYEKRRESDKTKEFFNRISGLPNRKKLESDLEDLVLDKDKEDFKQAFILVRLNSNFEVINQIMKPAITEWIIYKTSETLKKILLRNAVIYHCRDEEFIIYIKDYSCSDNVLKYSRFIHNKIKKTHILSEYHITISSYLSVVLIPEHGTCVNELLSNADIAIKNALEERRPIKVYNNSMRKKVIEKIELQTFIMKALEEQAITQINKQFELHYQPIIKIARKDNKKLFIDEISAETLIRWYHPAKGMIPPQKFIPLAEETGLIIPIGDWVLFSAADQINIWKAQGIDSKISINFSPVQFLRKNIFELLNNLIERKNIDPSNINIEITENTIMENLSNSITKLNKISELGFRISIDDFGTGYSSLGYLKEFPINYLKVDKSFINSICSDKYNRSIIRAVNSLSTELGFKVIVEGVEDIEQFVFLYSEGIEHFQGHFFSRALRPQGFADYYRKSISSDIKLNY